MILSIILIMAAGVVMVHCICLISKLSPRRWFGHRLQFFGLSAAYSFIAGGSVGIVFGWPLASVLLLFGVAGKILFERRNRGGA